MTKRIVSKHEIWDAGNGILYVQVFRASGNVVRVDEFRSPCNPGGEYCLARRMLRHERKEWYGAVFAKMLWKACNAKRGFNLSMQIN